LFLGIKKRYDTSVFRYSAVGFGAFGKPGQGYQINSLTKEIRRILRLGSGIKVALVGAGNLGSAMLAYPGFKTYGFNIVAIFDSAPGKIGKKINDRKLISDICDKISDNLLEKNVIIEVNE